MSTEISYLEVDMLLTRTVKEMESVLPPELGDPVRIKGRVILGVDEEKFTLTWVRNNGRLYTIKKVA